MSGVTWERKLTSNRELSPGGYLWRAKSTTSGYHVGSVYNDGVSVVNGRVVDHGSIHLAALRVQSAAEAYAKKEGSL